MRRSDGQVVTVSRRKGGSVVKRSRDGYRYPVGRLHAGSSLGNYAAFAQLDAETNLRGLWNASDNEYYAGDWIITLSADGENLEPTETAFRAESQSTFYTRGGLTAEKCCLLPFSVDERRPDDAWQFRRVVVSVSAQSRKAGHVALVVTHRLRLAPIPSELFTKKPPAEQTQKKFHIRVNGSCIEATTQSRPAEARAVISTDEPQGFSADETTAQWTNFVHIPPGGSVEITWVLAFAPDGLAAALKSASHTSEFAQVQQSAKNQWQKVLSRSQVCTADEVINRGVHWAKVNTLRVQHGYRLGAAFTNDPPQDIVVMRDLAWYVFGSDYVTPEFSQDLLALGASHAVHNNGKLTEYIHASESPPALHDYGLNMNDDTPLFVAALAHHAMVSGDVRTLANVYPVMRRACEYITSQIVDGLLQCRAKGSGVWGICSWRNVIENYSLTGAVTEINAECSHALAITSDAAERLGYTEEARRFAQTAAAVRSSVNERLVSDRTGLYVLNCDLNGEFHHDVTADLVFPVMFGIADDAMRQRILDRLCSDEFWTPYGVRTVSPREHNYDPDFGYQLMGGLWPNLTAWVSFLVRKERPELLIDGMRNIYRISEVETPKNLLNVVPGEFPERLHGKTFVSRGMTMSPWMPPTYLWLAVEGLMGVKPTFDGLEINPTIPSAWRWMLMHEMPYKGGLLSCLFLDGSLYCDYPIRSSFPVERGKFIPCRSTDEHLFVAGFVSNRRSFIFLSCDRDIMATAGWERDGRQYARQVSLRAGNAETIAIE